MFKRWLLFTTVWMVIGGLWLTPIKFVTAQEEETTEEVHEETTEEEVGARGPGAVIIMVGLAAILLVGFIYISRQENGSAATTH